MVQKSYTWCSFIQKVTALYTQKKRLWLFLLTEIIKYSAEAHNIEVKQGRFHAEACNNSRNRNRNEGFVQFEFKC